MAKAKNATQLGKEIMESAKKLKAPRPPRFKQFCKHYGADCYDASFKVRQEEDSEVSFKMIGSDRNITIWAGAWSPECHAADKKIADALLAAATEYHYRVHNLKVES